MYQLIHEYFAPEFELKMLSDSAVIDNADNKRIAFTTDSFVVSPIFFPGGDIGSLAIYGTVNDLSMVGAIPMYITVGFIIEEGFPISDLKKILKSMSDGAIRANVKIVSGDTKVVERGKADGIFINTSGVGFLEREVSINPLKITAGDSILLSAPIGLHGISIVAKRNGITFNPPVRSDCAPLNHLVQEMMVFSDGIHAMRDPTRGGLATTLKEIAIESGLCLEIDEEKITIPESIRGACDLLGYDPLYVANEGVLVAIVEKNISESLLSVMRSNRIATYAEIIGQVKESPEEMVILYTEIGGKRVIDMLPGELLPRIC